MNLALYYLKRPFVRLARFRHRCGYGVHSPFAFSLITDVIYEKRPYYAYAELKKEAKDAVCVHGREKGLRRVNRLLFRLVNYVQPDVMVEVGVPAVSSLYLQAACPAADYLFASDMTELFLEAGLPVSLLYLNDYHRPQLMEEVLQVCVPRADAGSLFVMNGIRYSKEMEKLWRRWQADGRVGITFDLYDVGLLFFDCAKIKQHYIVSF